MAARLTRITSIAALSNYQNHRLSTDTHNNYMYLHMFQEDLFLGLEDMSSLLSSPPFYTFSDVPAEPDAYNWWNHDHMSTAQLDEPFHLVPSSSAPHADNDKIHQYSSRSLWPVDQWSPPSCSTNYSSPESCSFSTATMDSPLHSDMSQHSDITDQNCQSCDQLNALSLNTLLQSSSSNTISTEAHDRTAAMPAWHDALPSSPQPSNALLSKMPSCNDVMGMEDDNVATSSKSSEALVHKFCIESNNLAIEDGYTWRKYGEKHIMGRVYKRAYFRCARSGCIVKKQVERSSDKDGFVVITYFGKHNHHPIH